MTAYQKKLTSCLGINLANTVARASELSMVRELYVSIRTVDMTKLIEHHLMNLPDNSLFILYSVLIVVESCTTAQIHRKYLITTV